MESSLVIPETFNVPVRSTQTSFVSLLDYWFMSTAAELSLFCKLECTRILCTRWNRIVSAGNLVLSFYFQNWVFSVIDNAKIYIQYNIIYLLVLFQRFQCSREKQSDQYLG